MPNLKLRFVIYGLNRWLIDIPAGFALDKVVVEKTRQIQPPSELAASSGLTPLGSDPTNNTEDSFTFSNEDSSDDSRGMKPTEIASHSSEFSTGAVHAIALGENPSRLSESDGTVSTEKRFVAIYTFGLFSMVATIAWAVTSFALSLRLALKVIAMNRLRSNTVVASSETIETCVRIASEMGVKAPQVLQSPFVSSPFLYGIRHPAIILSDQPIVSLTDVLAHELAHLRRFDCHWLLLRHVATIILFFQPLLWWLARRIDIASEEVCDDCVVQFGKDRARYANSLVEIATLSMAPEAIVGVGIVSLRSQLGRRVARIMDSDRKLTTRVGNRIRSSMIGSGLVVTSIVGIAGLSITSDSRTFTAYADEKAAMIEPKVDSTGESEKPSLEEKPTSVAGPVTGDIRVSGRIVDESDRPVEGVVVQFSQMYVMEPMTGKSLPTDANGRYEIVTKRSFPWEPSFELEALSEDGLKIAIKQYFAPNQSFQETQKALEKPPQALEYPDINLVLQPSRKVSVHVEDANGDSIPESRIAFRLVRNRLRFLETDKEGLASLTIASNEVIEAVVAWKDFMGLDYRLYKLSRYQQNDQLAVKPEFPISNQETLVLDGASPLTVRFVDEAKQPISDVRTYPWLLRKESEVEELNLSMFINAFPQMSSSQGIVQYNWFPIWQTNKVTIMPSSKDYAVFQALYDPQVDLGSLEVQLNALASVSGRVTLPDGSPAGGIFISATGAGFDLGGDYSFPVKTDVDGKFKMNLAPNRIYHLTIDDNVWASSPHTGFALLKNQVITDKNFVLRPATIVKGKLIDEETEAFIPGEKVWVYEFGQDLQSMKGVGLPNPAGSNLHVQPIKTHQATTDENGDFEFKLGDGSFDIRSPEQDRVTKFEIRGEPELEMIVKAKHRDVEILSGEVLLTEDFVPAVGATVTGVPQNFRIEKWKATTSAYGTFRVITQPSPCYLHIESADKRYGAVVNLEENQNQIHVTLLPVGSISGRLLDKSTGMPLPGKEIEYGTQVPSENDQSWRTSFGGKIITDREGKFRIERLVQEREYHLKVVLKKDRNGLPLGWQGIKNLELNSDKHLDLGDLMFTPRPLP